MGSLLLFLACSEATPEAETPVEDASAELAAEMPTVATVRWSTDRPTVGRVEWGDGERSGDESAATTDHEVVVVGLLPETTYALQAMDEEVAHGQAVEVTTGAIDSALPGLTVEKPLVPVLACQLDVGADPLSSVVLVNRDGEVVWGFSEAGMLVFYAGLLSDNRGVWALASTFGDGPSAYVVEMTWTGERTEIAAPGLHHDLRPMDDGGYLGTRSAFGELDGQPLMGDELVYLAADGEVTPWWSAFEDLPAGAPWEGSTDWTHANGLDVADDGRIALSLFGTKQLVLLDASGNTEHVLGPDGDVVTDFTFGPQHAPRFTADGLWLFDNGVAPDASRAIRFELDGTAATAREILPVSDGGRTDFLGDVRVLSTGETLMATGYDSQVYVLDAGATVGHYSSDRVLGGVVPIEAWP